MKKQNTTSKEYQHDFHGKLVSFAKGEYQNPVSKEKTFCPILNFENGEKCILFHAALKNQIGDAVKKGFLDIGCDLAIIRGELKTSKNDMDYYAYQIIIDGVPFVGNNIELNKTEFIDELFN